MTFSIAARCAAAEEMGVVIASSSTGVASRRAFVRTGAESVLMGVGSLHSLSVH